MGSPSPSCQAQVGVPHLPGPLWGPLYGRGLWGAPSPTCRILMGSSFLKCRQGWGFPLPTPRGAQGSPHDIPPPWGHPPIPGHTRPFLIPTEEQQHPSCRSLNAIFGDLFLSFWLTHQMPKSHQTPAEALGNISALAATTPLKKSPPPPPPKKINTASLQCQQLDSLKIPPPSPPKKLILRICKASSWISNHDPAHLTSRVKFNYLFLRALV